MASTCSPDIRTPAFKTQVNYRAGLEPPGSKKRAVQISIYCYAIVAGEPRLSGPVDITNLRRRIITSFRRTIDPIDPKAGSGHLCMKVNLSGELIGNNCLSNCIS